MDPRDDVKDALHALIFAVMFTLLCVLVLPVLIKFLDRGTGKALYRVLAAGAVALALWLRVIARRL